MAYCSGTSTELSPIDIAGVRRAYERRLPGTVLSPVASLCLSSHAAVGNSDTAFGWECDEALDDQEWIYDPVQSALHIQVPGQVGEPMLPGRGHAGLYRRPDLGLPLWRKPAVEVQTGAAARLWRSVPHPAQLWPRSGHDGNLHRRRHPAVAAGSGRPLCFDALQGRNGEPVPGGEGRFRERRRGRALRRAFQVYLPWW